MSTVDRPITDVDHAFRQIVVGIDVLEGRMARAPEQRSTDDDLLLTSLAFSLERLARETAPSIADPAQRAELALAAARIRAVIDELGTREPAGVEAPTTQDEPEPEAELLAVAPPEPRWTAGRIRRICGLALLGIGVVLALFLVYEFAFTG